MDSKTIRFLGERLADDVDADKFDEALKKLRKVPGLKAVISEDDIKAIKYIALEKIHKKG